MNLPAPPPAARPHAVAQVLVQAQAAGVERVDAFALLGHVLGCSRTWLLAHDDTPVAPPQQAAFAALCARRQLGEPVAYLLGWREFYGLRLQVNPSVLIPRPETEGLVDWGLERLADRDAPVVDLGTGSGAIALALASQGATHVTALDASAEALAVASANGQRLGLAVDWRLGHWWQACAPHMRYAVALANPPYVADHDPHLIALGHEPETALRSGPDGLADLRHIIASAPGHLSPDGWLLLEHGHDQSAAVTALLSAAGFVDVHSRPDIAGHLRCSGGRFPSR